jgi:hypothetical protein
MLAVCLLEQVKPSLIVAARRRAAALSTLSKWKIQNGATANHPPILALTMSGDIARQPPGNPSLRLV